MSSMDLDHNTSLTAGPDLVRPRLNAVVLIEQGCNLGYCLFLALWYILMGHMTL